MRILKIANIPDDRNTGMGRVMHATADHLRAMGHGVDFLFAGDVGRARLGRGDRFGFPVALVGAVRRAMRDRGTYDVVEIHEPAAAWYCLQRRRDPAALPPCVVMSHGLEETQWQLRLQLDRLIGQRTSWKSRLLVPATLLPQARYGLLHCQQVMCLNSYDEAYLRDRLHLPAERISRVTNGVDTMFFAPPDALERYGDAVRLLFVGSWLEKKGRRFLVQTFERLWERYGTATSVPAATRRNLRLSLLGTGMSENEVLRSFTPAVRGAITVRPRVNDRELSEAYASHHIFAFPTYFEPWGLVLLEAAAAGMALATTGAGGPADLFTDGCDALLVPPADSEGFTNAVGRLIEDGKERARLGENARNRAWQFSWHAAAEGHLRAYERARAIAAAEMAGARERKTRPREVN